MWHLESKEPFGQVCRLCNGVRRCYVFYPAIIQNWTRCSMAI